MRIVYALIGIAVAAAIGYKIHSTPPTSAPMVATPVDAPTASPSPTASATPQLVVPTASAFVRVPDLAHRPLDVAEYLLSSQGLGHTVIGPDQYDYDATQLRVCSTLPRANTVVRSGTRVGLVVRWHTCVSL